MSVFIPFVGTFLLVFLPALGLLIAGLAREARLPAYVSGHRSAVTPRPEARFRPE